jgi:hypothetical protein
MRAKSACVIEHNQGNAVVFIMGLVRLMTLRLISMKGSRKCKKQ